MPITRQHFLKPTTGECEFSPCRGYRYWLRRVWRPGDRLANYLMLNPSTADEFKNDPTVERCEQRARADGFDGFVVTNIFAFRATDPNHMKAQADPVGPENDDRIVRVAGICDQVVCAWGTHGRHLGRADEVRRLLVANRIAPMALRLTRAGDPSHPLYLPYDLKPTPWVLT
jgi:hypothetical protein